MEVLNLRLSKSANYGTGLTIAPRERFWGGFEMGKVIKRTPTETLVTAMEEVGDATECLVIMTKAGGDIITLGSTSVFSTRLGMLEMAKTLILKDVITRR